jgi:hypothetical protein
MTTKLEFDQEYIKSCFNACQGYDQVNQLVKSLEDGNYDSVRIHLDHAIDDLQNQINQPIGENEEPIHNARVYRLKSMFECWNKLFIIIEEQLDGRENTVLSSTGSK